MTTFDSWDSYFNDNPQDPSIAEDHRVLRNLLGATTAQDLAEQEKIITLARVDELEAGEVGIEGNFDFDHHSAIHRHIFCDVYEWAGEPRTVDMSKTHRLWPAANIVDAAPSVYGAIARDGYLQNMDHDQFVSRLAEHWGEVNVLHGYREGNTRSQRAFFSQLAAQAGYVLDGHYLEAHYRDFNVARETAMTSGRSEQFAVFLAGAVPLQGSPPTVSVDLELKAQVERLRDAAFPKPASEATRTRPGGRPSQPRPTARPQQYGQGHGIGK